MWLSDRQSREGWIDQVYLAPVPSLPRTGIGPGSLWAVYQAQASHAGWPEVAVGSGQEHNSSKLPLPYFKYEADNSTSV